MIKQLVMILIAVLAVLLMTGCFFEIKDDVDYPVNRFKKTLARIEKLQTRGGDVDSIHFLIYDASERRLVALNLPAGMAKSALAEAMPEKAREKDLEKYTDAAGFDLSKLSDLDRIGPGLLVEVEIEEEDGKKHVLIWLD